MMDHFPAVRIILYFHCADERAPWQIVVAAKDPHRLVVVLGTLNGRCVAALLGASAYHAAGMGSGLDGSPMPTEPCNGNDHLPRAGLVDGHALTKETGAP